MEATKLGNLKLYGTGHAAGGAYHHVSIKGKGVIGEGLSAAGCRIFGTGLFSGKRRVNGCVYSEKVNVKVICQLAESIFTAQ